MSLNIIAIPNIVSKGLWKRESSPMRQEMSALKKNRTSEIVDKLKGKNIDDCKWIVTTKY